MKKKNYTTLRNFIFGLLIILPYSLFSQLNKVDKVIEKIQENNFKKAIEIRNKLKDETPIVLYNFVNHLVFNDIDFEGRNIDSAYFYLLIVSSENKLIESTVKSEYCSRFKLCEVYLNDERLKLENEAFTLYSKDSNLVSLNYFIKHFENEFLKEKASKLIESIVYNKASKTNTSEVYVEYLKLYPNSAFTKDAKNRWEELEFKKCLSNNEEDAYRTFLINFPLGKNLTQAKVNLGKVVYEKTLKSENISDYEAFLNEFHNKGSITDLSAEVLNIQSKLCFLNFNKLKNCSSIDSLKQFLWDFEDCQYADSIKLKIELIDFSNLNKSFSIEMANGFLKNYPESNYNKLVLSRLFELEYPIIKAEENENKLLEFKNKYEAIDAGEKLSVLDMPIIYKSNINGYNKFGFINPVDNNIIIYPIYNEARDFSNGLAAVKFNGFWGFVDKTGSVIIDFVYEDVRDFHEGIAGVKDNGLWVIIDKSNSTITNQKFQNVGICNSGLINVNNLTSGWSFISKDGKVQSKGVSYQSASSFDSGYAFVQEGSRYFILDTFFKKIFEVDYNLPMYNNYSILEACSGFEASPERNILCNFYERRAPYSIKKYGDVLLLNEGLVYDLKRNACWISEFVYFDKQILVFGNRITQRSQRVTLCLYSYNGKQQYFSIKQDDYGSSKFVEITRESNNIVLNYSTEEFNVFRILSLPDVKTEKYKVINNKGQFHFEDKNKEVLGSKMDYTYASEFLNGRAVVGVLNKYVLIDSNANQYGDVFDKITRVNSQIYVVNINGSCFLMDISGNYLSNGYYSIDSKVYDNTLLVTSGNLKGFIDVKGKEIIKPQFLDAQGFSNGKAIVMVSNGKSNCSSWDCMITRVIDKKGYKLYGDYKNFIEYNPYMSF